MADLLTLDRDARRIDRLTIRRPEVRNALDEQAFDDLIAACEHVGKDPEARVQANRVRSKAFREGLDAARNKRPPVFQGR